MFPLGHSQNLGAQQGLGLLRQRSLNRAMYRFLGLLFLLLLWTSPGWGLPIISPAKDLGYIAPDPKVREAFFKERQAFVDQALKEIKALLPKASPQERKRLREAQDMLKRLPLLWGKIKTECKTQEKPLPVEIPPLKGPPYALETFKVLLDQDFQVEEELRALKERISFQKLETKRLEDGLEQLYAEYVNLWQKDPRPAEAYVRLAEFLTLQARYALAKFDLQRNTSYQARLANLQAELEETLKKVFARLQITQKDFQDLAQKHKALVGKIKAQERALQEERQIVEKALALVNIELLRAEDQNSSPKALLLQKRWEAAKERLELELDLLAKKKYLQELRLARLEFWQEWLRCYRFCSRRQRLKEIKVLKQKYLNFRLGLEEFTRSRDYLTRRLLALEGAISLHTSELKNHSPQQQALRDLLREEKRLAQEAQKAAQFYQDAVQYLKQGVHHLHLVVYLWKTQVGFWGNLFSRSWQTVERVFDRVNFVLHYPLWTLRGTTFTVLSLLKAFSVLILGILLLKFIRWRLERLLIHRFKMAPGLVNSLATLSYYTLLVLVVLVALSTAGVNLNQVALIFGALSVGIGFGLQTIANNFISGIILLTERSIKVGDLVQFEDGTIGVVKKINIRSTVIRTFDALEIIVPNSEFISQRISTWTYGDDWRRILIPFGVAYGTDPEKVREVATKAARSVPITHEDADHPIRVRFVGFGDSSLDFELAVWIRQAEVNRAMTGIKSDYYYALYRHLSQAGIEIPFPQRDIHLRSVYPEVWQALKQGLRGGREDG